MSRLRLLLLGTFQAFLDGMPLTGFASNKVRGLLAYLAVEAKRPHSRETLATLLWPDSAQQQALYYLRNALSDLRRMLDDRQSEIPFLLISHRTLQFNPGSAHWLDVAEFQQLSNPPNPRSLASPWGSINLEECERAVDLYQGEFLEGFSIESVPFEEWALLRGEQYHQQMLENLHFLTDFYLESGDFGKASQHARRQVGMEPWREEAYRQGMLALARGGQRGEALAEYEACRRHLRNDLGVEPSAETQRLYECIRDGTIPPAPEKKPRFHNLPAQMTSFIGREAEIEQVKSLLEEHRLVTLTGAGGVGKSRLCLRVAEEVLKNFPDGAWLVELAPLSDAELVPQMVARQLSLGERSGAQTLSLLQDYLENKQLLLIIDNCEHLVEACARLAETLLANCPQLHLLITSREKLGMAGEVVFRVPCLARSEAMRLFLERARMASLGFELTAANAPAITAICMHLDGIPLAIELAAARTSVIQVEEIARHLDDRFRLLTGGDRTALPRYQTLRASIDWSYALLSASERTLLQRLSVFAGSWMLAAAEAVCSGEGIETGEVLDLLSQLVNKSLVTVEALPGLETRYRMLETIRQYAQEKLVEMGEAEQGRQRHLQYYCELAEKVESRLRGPEQAKLFEFLEIELANLRLALEWSLASEEQPGYSLQAGLRIAAALRWFWHSVGRQYEGMQWLERLLAAEGEARRLASAEAEKSFSPEQMKVRAWALMVAGHLEFQLADVGKFYTYLDESRGLFLDLGIQGRLGYANVLWILACLAGESDFPRSNRLTEEGLSIFQEEGDALGMGQCNMLLGINALYNEEYDRARAYFEKQRDCHQQIGDQDGVGGALYFLGELALRCGDAEQARSLFEQSLKIQAEIRNVAFTHPRTMLGVLDWMEGNESQAVEKFEQTLSTALRMGHPYGVLRGLDHLGRLALSRGDFRQAAKRFKEQLDYCGKKGLKGYTVWSLSNSGYLAWVEGDTKLAIAKYTEALEVCRENSDLSAEVAILMGLGKVAIDLGNLRQARGYLLEALKNWQNNYPWWSCRFIFEAFATLEAACEKWKRAARLLGFTEATHQRFQRLRTPKECEIRLSTMAAVRKELGEEAFAAAWQEGEGMGLKEAAAFVSAQPSFDAVV